MKSARCWGAIANAIGVVLTLTACGTDDTSTADSAAASSSRNTPGAHAGAGYSGPEKGLPTQYPRPEKKAGEKFVVGMLSPTQSEPLLQEMAAAASAEAKKLGGTLIVKDAQVSPDKQVSQFNELMAQGVTSILWFPMDPRNSQPQIKQAKAKGIPMIGIASPDFIDDPPIPGFTSNVTQGNDQMAYYDAKAMADSSPGGEFAIITLSGPAFSAAAVRVRRYATQMGLKDVGTAEVTAPTADAAGTAMSGLIAQHPNLEAVWTFTDVMGLGAASVARSSGKQIFITGRNGDTAALEAIAAGRLGATYAYDGAEMGRQVIWGAYNAQTSQGTPLPESVVVPGTPVTEANAGEVLAKRR